MNILMKLLMASLILAASTALAQAKEWHGIVPLHSTRADVERLMGKPTVDNWLYDFESERASITYVDRPCGQIVPKGKETATDLVDYIFVVYQKLILLSDLRLEPAKFKKTDAGDVADIYDYVNEEEGVIYGVDESRENEHGPRPRAGAGKVIEATYFPTAKDAEQCQEKCDGSAANLELIITTGAQNGDMWQEQSRFIVKLPSANPTIGEIIAEIRKHPLKKHMEALKPHFFLRREGTRERMDETKTAADYGLKNCSVLRLLAALN